MAGSRLEASAPVLFVLLCALVVPVAGQDVYRVDPDSSLIEIHLEPGGFFSFLGDRHLIQAPILRGHIRDYPEARAGGSASLLIDAASLRVVDPHLSREVREEVQQIMKGPQVLHVENYPQIAFHSEAVLPLVDGRLEIQGRLRLRGTEQPVRCVARLEGTPPPLRATGACRLRQTSFGIVPFSYRMGLVRVHDEIRVTFSILALPEP